MSLKTSCIIVTCVLYSIALSSEQDTQPSLIHEVVSVRIEAVFSHGLPKAVYSSQWSGLVNMAVVQKWEKGMKMEFRTGIGKFPSNLRCSWRAMQQDSISTAPVPICLVSTNITENQLNQWIKGQGGSNPSLAIEFEAEPNSPGRYSNRTDITGQVFVWDSLSKPALYRRYAYILIPRYCLELNMSAIPNAEEVGMPTLRHNSAVTGASANANVGGGIVLSKIPSRIWHNIIANGNEHIGLSKATPDALSLSFSAFIAQKVPADTAILLRQLYTTIEELYTTGALSPKDVQQLIADLDGAVIEQQNAKLSRELAELVRFNRNIERLASGGNLDPQTAKIITDQTTAALNSITDYIKPVILPYFMPMLPPEHKSWYVDWRHSCPTPADGSLEHPFISIAAALEEAQNQGLGGVTLFVFGGTYDESLDITRETSLYAMPHQVPVITETITNMTSSRLSISGFYIVGATAPAAIWVNHPNATTILNHIVIEDANGFGIYQIGGQAQLDTVRISGTRSGAGSIWVGSGALFANGAEVTLTDVCSELNESCGMMFDGPGTCVTGSNVTIQQNRFNRNWSDELVSAPLYFGSGALEVQNYAEAEFDHLIIRDNEIDGLLVHDYASVTLTNATIERTRQFVPEGGWRGPERGGGIGARVRAGGQIEVTNFSIDNCDLAGIIISTDGQVDLHIGQICGHPIGVAILPEEYDLNRLMDGVIYCDNERNIDTRALSVPDVTTSPP